MFHEKMSLALKLMVGSERSRLLVSASSAFVLTASAGFPVAIHDAGPPLTVAAAPIFSGKVLGCRLLGGLIYIVNAVSLWCVFLAGVSHALLWVTVAISSCCLLACACIILLHVAVASPAFFPVILCLTFGAHILGLSLFIEALEFLGLSSNLSFSPF